MGGYAAFEILRQSLERFLAAAFVSKSARADTPEGKELRQQTIDRVSDNNFYKLIDAVIDLDLPEARRSDPVLRTTIEKMARDVGIKTLINHQIATQDRQSSLPGLKDIKCRTMVVVGKQDILKLSFP